jgi:hypothetical protein
MLDAVEAALTSNAMNVDSTAADDSYAGSLSR